MRRILVIRIDFLGDMICTTALLQSIKQRWPEAELHVLANKYNAAALEGNPVVHRVHRYVYSKKYEKNQRPGLLNALIDRLRLIFQLRHLKFDLLVIPNGGMNKSSIQFAKLLNVKDSRWHTSKSEFDDRNPSHIANRRPRHEVLYGYELLPELETPDIQRLSLAIYPDADLQRHWRQRLAPHGRPRVGFFTSNKSDARRWSWEKWRQLAQKLSAVADIIVFSVPGAEPTPEQQNAIKARCIVTPGVADLFAAASLLDVIVSADSAPVHIGGALKVPVVALFESRPEKYLRWHPLGVEYILLHAGAVVDDISVSDVETAVCSLLQVAMRVTRNVRGSPAQVGQD
ncbi:glycosyltransferase family 9 protein [Affinibrenneria salicis]|uniref:Glycosyltransferase family 9 protein n=1 Tax=Affinibrenneria salicis TaxID=2590031 RepID=A0A5J5FUW1_9GAMM|nr:glycosyltransferase family 9 protein [Affinibrenneria salicis]KAA8997309.1 glycosyltransferase family 9 protein [Affinibrenneria salicis]